MRTRFYLITSGAYDSYRVYALLKGPRTPALSTLYKKFRDEYGLRLRTLNSAPTMSALDAFYARYKAECDAVDRLTSDGYSAAGFHTRFTDMGSLFTDWVLKNYPQHFELVDVDWVHVQ